MALEFECTRRIAAERPDLISELEGLEADAKRTIVGDVEGFIEHALATLITNEDVRGYCNQPADDANWPKIMSGPITAM
jgi:hypothetical protein